MATATDFEKLGVFYLGALGTQRAENQRTGWSFTIPRTL